MNRTMIPAALFVLSAPAFAQSPKRDATIFYRNQLSILSPIAIIDKSPLTYGVSRAGAVVDRSTLRGADKFRAGLDSPPQNTLSPVRVAALKELLGAPADARALECILTGSDLHENLGEHSRKFVPPPTSAAIELYKFAKRNAGATGRQLTSSRVLLNRLILDDIVRYDPNTNGDTPPPNGLPERINLTEIARALSQSLPPEQIVCLAVDSRFSREGDLYIGKADYSNAIQGLDLSAATFQGLAQGYSLGLKVDLPIGGRRAGFQIASLRELVSLARRVLANPESSKVDMVIALLHACIARDIAAQNLVEDFYRPHFRAAASHANARNLVVATAGGFAVSKMVPFGSIKPQSCSPSGPEMKSYRGPAATFSASLTRVQFAELQFGPNPSFARNAWAVGLAIQDRAPYDKGPGRVPEDVLNGITRAAGGSPSPGNGDKPDPGGIERWRWQLEVEHRGPTASIFPSTTLLQLRHRVRGIYLGREFSHEIELSALYGVQDGGATYSGVGVGLLHKF